MVALATVPWLASAQIIREANVWRFGHYAGLDFNSGTPVALPPSAMYASIGCASIADSNGNLLFYTNGDTIWDKTDSPMPNGTGLSGYVNLPNSAFIVSDPANGSMYYVFTPGYNGASSHYSKVDMTLNGGLGDVVVKDSLLVTNGHGSITATRHANGRDVWLITYGTGLYAGWYLTWLIDSAGINGPWYTGGVKPSLWPPRGMKCSPQGNRLAHLIAPGQPPLYAYEAYIEIMDFDNSSGLGSNPYTIGSLALLGYTTGIEFSPSGRYLYVSGFLSSQPWASYLYQFDLHAGPPSQIEASGVLIETTSYALGQLQTGPDGKMYQAVFDTVFTGFINVINSPNEGGLNCQYDTNQFLLYPGTGSTWGLPPFLTSYFSPFTHKGLCFGDYTHFYVSDSARIDSVHWNFGDPLSGNANTSSGFSVYHQFTDTGYYDVSLIYFRGSSVDTFTNEIRIWEVPDVDFGPDVHMCRGDSVMLDAFYPKATYQWSDGSMEDTIWIYTAGTYWVKVMNPCDTVMDTIVVSYTVLADFASGPNCVGVPTQFADSSASLSGTIISWNWNFNNLDTSTQQHPTFIWPTSGLKTVTLIVTTDHGCSDTISKFVMAYNPPALSTAGDATICLGDSAQLTATGTGTVSWSPGITLDDSTSKIPVATPSVGTIYTVTLTALTGCTRSDSVTVNVAAIPVVTTDSVAVVCNASPVQLSTTATDTSGIATWSWSPTTGLSDPTIPDPTANPAVQTAYTVTTTNNHGCSASDSVTVLVSNVSASAGNDVTICEGDSTQLGASSPNVISSWSWSPVVSLSDPNVADPIASPLSTTTYIVTATDSLGCSLSDEVTINVTPYPTVTITPDTFVCAGGNVQLSVSGGVQYVWDLSVPGLNCYFCSGPMATPNFTSLYPVTVTGASGCMKDTGVTVDVLPLPVVDAGADASACSGDSVTLTASGAMTYEWQPGALTGAIIIIAPDSTTTFIVTGTDAFGCDDTDTVTAFIFPLPAVNAGQDVAICEGDSVTLTATSPAAVHWEPGTWTYPSITVSPATTTTYTAVAVDASTCENTDEVTVTVNPLPTVTASASPSVICEGASVSLSASGAATYLWSNGMPGTPISVTPDSSTTYHVTGTDVNGCIGTDSVSVTVHEVARIVIAGNNRICMGDSTVLSTEAGYSSYLWSPTGDTTSSITVKPTVSTSYSVTATDSNGCQTSTSISVLVFPQPVADFTFSQSAGLVQFTDKSIDALDRNWDFGDGETSSAQHPQHQYDSNGTYTVTLIVSNGDCTDTISNQIIITGVGINRPARDELVRVYPNPVRDELMIEIALAPDQIEVLLFNALGELIHRSDPMIANAPQVVLPTGHLAAGVYVVQVRLSEGAWSGTVVKL